MARRSLSREEIKNGVSYIHQKFVEKKMSARDVAKDDNLPFSLTTYYKYLPRYEKQLAASTEVKTTDTKPDDKYNKLLQQNQELRLENQELQDEIIKLQRFLVNKLIEKEEYENGIQNRNTTPRVHFRDL